MGSLPIRPRLFDVIAVLCVGAFSGWTLANYRSQAGQERNLATTSLQRAVATLQAAPSDATAPLSDYRRELTEARRHLRSALVKYPVDSGSIARLAAVEWEISALNGGMDDTALLSLVEIARLRAPRDSEAQIALGSLLYRMGQSTSAAEYMRRCVQLEPPLARRVVAAMTEDGVSLTGIATTLPLTPEVLLSLADLYARAGLDSEFCALVESRLGAAPPELIRTYSDIALRAGRARELLSALLDPAADGPPSSRPLREVERARAHLALGELASAQALMARARVSSPRDPHVLELLGDIELQAGDPSTALQDLHEALHVLASSAGSVPVLARLYGRIGQAEEAAGRPEAAFDAYRRALRLDGEEPVSRARIDAMESAAGLAPPHLTHSESRSTP